MNTEEFRKSVYPDLRPGLRDLVMLELEGRDRRIKELEKRLARAVQGSDLIDLLHAYSQWLSGFWDRSIDSTTERAKEYLMLNGYIPDDSVKPSRGEMEAQVGQPAHERLAQMVKDIAGMKV